jgi:dolichol-phosphate mannosyltransferase
MMQSRTLILLPTYNEAENLPPMLTAIHENLPDADVLIIDDNSPDGTGRIAQKAADDDKRVHVAHRPGKQGLGVAYRYGYQWALDQDQEDEPRYSRVIQMDCDFSHSPGDLQRLENLLDAYPVVVGSRRAPNGGVVGWPLHRRLISRAGSLYAQSVLSSPVRDLTAGFKGFRREALAALELQQLNIDGFGFQIEVTAHLLARGFAIHEMPIRFSDRTVGQSKMTTQIFVEAMFKVWKIRSSIRDL